MEPSLDPTERVEDDATPLAAALLPVLLHRINNVTQLLTSVNSILAMTVAEAESGGGAGAPSLARGDDLLAAARDADELGWLLGVVGCGLGADLLLERRERRGLDACVRLVRQALQRAGAELELEPATELPSLTSAVPSHGDLCWLVAYGLWSAQGGTARLAHEPDSDTYTFDCEGAAPVDWASVRAALTERLPGCTLESEGPRWTLLLPATWLEPAT